MPTKLMLSTLLCACLTACASAPAPATSQAPAAAELACNDGPLLRRGDVAAVEPLWAANKLVKSPSYQLAGVIVELHPNATPTREDLATAISCRSACALAGEPDLLALPGLRATLSPSSDHLTMILRSDDPATAREAMLRAETLLSRR